MSDVIIVSEQWRAESTFHIKQNRHWHPNKELQQSTTTIEKPKIVNMPRQTSPTMVTTGTPAHRASVVVVCALYCGEGWGATATSANDEWCYCTPGYIIDEIYNLDGIDGRINEITNMDKTKSVKIKASLKTNECYRMYTSTSMRNIDIFSRTYPPEIARAMSIMGQVTHPPMTMTGHKR